MSVVLSCGYSPVVRFLIHSLACEDEAGDERIWQLPDQRRDHRRYRVGIIKVSDCPLLQSVRKQSKIVRLAVSRGGMES